jgi:hypothetical protein
MVSYQVWTRICYSVAEEKGAQFSGIEDGAAFTSEIATYWNENKLTLVGYTEAQARKEAEEVVSG